MGRYTFTHHSPLVIILKIKLNGVLTLPFEGDAPRTVDMHAVALWLALQSMEIKTQNILSLWRLGNVNCIEPTKRPFSQGRLCQNANRKNVGNRDASISHLLVVHLCFVICHGRLANSF